MKREELSDSRTSSFTCKTLESQRGLLSVTCSDWRSQLIESFFLCCFFVLVSLFFLSFSTNPSHVLSVCLIHSSHPLIHPLFTLTLLYQWWIDEDDSPPSTVRETDRQTGRQAGRYSARQSESCCSMFTRLFDLLLLSSFSSSVRCTSGSS